MGRRLVSPEGAAGPGRCGRASLETIEGYDIVEKIGEGGMGQVYRAVHRRLDRPVAIKRLAPHLSHNQDMLKRFLQEARLQARLTHPNVVNIFDLIENDQGIFLVMEYVEGQTARDMLQGRERLSAAEALMIAEGVLSGLAFMHKNGVVHRDIKPSNIMVSVSGTVKVTDFGIARLVNEETGLTRFGGGIGTLHYMAPELIKSGQVSFAIDIYSLGATLHELLAGKPPFVGNTDLEIMMGHLEKEPPRIDFLPADEAGKACQALIETALAKAPQDRFPSAEAFLAEVRRVRGMLAAPKSGPAQVEPPKAPRAAEPGAPAPPSPAPGAEPRAGEKSGGDKATSPTSVALPPQAASPTRAAAGSPPRAEKKPAPAAGAPKKGRLGLVAGLGAAVVLAVVVFWVLRPGPTPPGPALAPVAETPAPPPSPAAVPAPEAEKAAEPAPQAVSRDVPAAAPVAEMLPPAASPSEVLPPSTPEPASPPPAPVVDAPVAAEIPAQAPEATAPAAAGETSVPSPVETSAPASDAGPSQDAGQAVEEAAPATPEKREIYVGENDARLREQPDTSSKILTTLDLGTRLVVLEDVGEWIKVSEPDGQIGYISAKLTAGSPPAPSSAPKAPPRPVKPAPRRPAQKPADSDQPGWSIVK